MAETTETLLSFRAKAVAVAMAVVLGVVLAVMPQAVCGQAWASPGLQAGSVSSSALSTQAGKLRVSKTYLNLTPKSKRLSNGYSYSPRKATVTVTMPFRGTVYYKTTDPCVATCKWSMKWSGWKTKLTITGHARGEATVVIYNSANSQKVRIKVVVGGCTLGVRLNSPVERVYQKSDGTNGYYRLNNVTLINDSKLKATFNKICVFKVWTVDENGDYVDRNAKRTIRNLPVTIDKGKKRRVYLGQKIYVDADGNYLDEDSETNYYQKVAFTLKVGKSYVTFYADAYGMITKYRLGRDF